MLSIKSPALKASFSDIGARLMALEVDGVDVVFGNAYDFDPYKDDAYPGVTCGRYAGRITGSQFELDGAVHKLAPNQDGFQLHGGPDGLGHLKWQSKKKGSEVVFELTSPDGDQGFPGELKVTATYGVKGNVLYADLEAVTSKPTVINLTNHAYWNLAGQTAGKDSALSQEIQINASRYLPIHKNLTPTGVIADVKGTEFDFRKLRAVGQPYDHCFCLDGKRGQLHQALTQRDPQSGRRMEVWTTECAVQFYTAIHWNTKLKGKSGPMQQHQAIAIEPQNFPDAPNNPNFPSSVLRPGRTYLNRIEWRFY